MRRAARAHRWSRRRILGAATVGVLAAACGAEREPTVVEPRPAYWEPALTVATRALDVLRMLEHSTRALAQGALTTDRFVTAAQTQFPEIAALSELVIPLVPPPDARDAHAHLTAAVDALVEVVPTIRGYEATEQPEQLVHVATLERRVRSELGQFIEGIGPGRASSGLRTMLEDLGDFELDVWRVPKLAVLVGQFDSEAEARARLGALVHDIRLSQVFQRWVEVGRFGDAAAASTAAAEWRERGFETRVERVADLAFDLRVLRPAVARSWKEPAWLARVEFDATHLDSSARGERIVAVSRAGQVAAFNAAGESLWTRDVQVPLARASVHPSGAPIAVHGFDLVLLEEDGEPIWPVPVRPDNQLLEQVLFDETGYRLVVRSTNASGLGHVFAFNRHGQVWGPTKEYIGAAWVDFHPPTGTVAVGSSKLGENQVVLIRSDGNLHQRFGVGGDILQVLFTRSGKQTIALTTAGMQVFDSDSGDSLWQLRFPASAAARVPGTDTVILAGDVGVGAFGIDASEIWFVPGLQARQVLPTRDYAAAAIDDLTVTIIRSDGSLLGDATTPSAIRGLAVAPERNLLIVLSADRSLQAWQLPEVQPAPSG